MTQPLIDLDVLICEELQWDYCVGPGNPWWFRAAKVVWDISMM